MTEGIIAESTLTQEVQDKLNSGGMSWSVVTVDTGALADNGYLVKADANNLTITLPASPTAGDVIGVKAFNISTGSVTVDGNGNLFNGVDADQDLINDIGFIYSYSGAAIGWVEISDANANATSIASVPVSPAVTPDTEDVCGPEKVSDYNMLRPDTSDWSVVNATAAKVIGTYGQFLEVTNVTGNGYAFEDFVFESGEYFDIELEMWGDGVSYPFIADSGATVQAGTPSTTLQSYTINNYVGIGSQLRCVVVGGTVGGIAGFRLVSVKKCRTIQNTDKIHSLVKPYNGVTQSEDLVTGWPGTATVDGNQTEIIGSAATTDHFREQEFDFTAGLISFSALLSPGAQGWNKLEIDDGTTQFYAFVNATTGEIGDTNGTSGATATVENDGRVRAKISAVCAADTGALNIYAAPSGTVSSYLGDGTTVDSYVTELHQWPGGIADNPAYVQTTTAAKTSEVSSMELVDNSAAKYAIGALRPYGGTGWEIPKESTPTVQYWYIAPNEVQHLGGGQQVLAMRFGALTNGQTLGNGRLVGGSMRVETGANNFRSGSLSFSDAAGTTVNLEDKSGVITATVSGWVGIEFGTLYFIQ